MPLNFYKRDPDRALSGMAELTLKQRGGYNSLIDLLYSRDDRVRDDDVKVAHMINVHPNEWRAVKSQLIELGKVWVDQDGFLRARRVSETIKDATNFAQTQSKRVTKRWEKEKSSSDNNDALIRAGNTNTATATATANTPHNPPNGFDAFWDCCPRKVGKGAARKAYTAAVKATSADLLCATMRAYGASRIGEPEQYTVHPATWLRSERWLDQGNGIGPPPSAEEIEIAKDKADRLLKRGKYRETYT